MWTQLFFNEKKAMQMIEKVSACLHLQGVTSSYSVQQQQLTVKQQQLWQIYLDRFSAMPQHSYWQNMGITHQTTRRVLIERIWVIFTIQLLLFKLNV